MHSSPRVYTAVFTDTFQADVARKKGNGSEEFFTHLNAIIYLLERDLALPPQYRRRRIMSLWQGLDNCWFCDVDERLLLLYRLAGSDLELLRLGTYAEIFRN